MFYVVLTTKPRAITSYTNVPVLLRLYWREYKREFLLTRLEKPIEGESQEALEEDEALRANEEDATPISDDNKVEETEDVESNIEPEALY
ncbi:uncharacterized protein N7525_005498 [Penicillium rubens]|uniref:uncharacterized protein n=1 Tax=Penicillium rubens TaxID=1108849 RepID=UPI002A5AA358|nr:uncharacterized protein N7525_005498 [Penicillium rubens]KAJ5840310.1 hypothetical protein N7525_005498 [Penicillium rubens]